MSRDIPSSKFWISYTRLSFEDSELGGVGIVDQHRTNIATILGTNEQVLHLSDSGGHRSGRSDKQRPDWRLAVSLLTNNPLCLGIVATFQDRLSRDVGDTAALVKMCENLNKHLILPTEGVDTRRTGWSPEVKMMIHLKASFAQMYAEDIGRKIKKRVDQINGALIPWGKPPFGQVRVGRGLNARIVANSDAPAVVRALTIYAAGSSCFKTLTELNTEGVFFRSRSGVPCHWREESVRTVVGNVLSYAGYFVPVVAWDAKASRIILTGEGNYLQRYVNSLGAQRSPNVEAIIDAQLADRVIERRFLNQLAGRKNPDWTPLLTPVLFYQGQKMRAASLPYGRYYRTSKSGIYTDADKLDAKVLGHLSDLHLPMELRERVHEALLKRVDEAKVASLQARGEGIHRKQQMLVSLLMDDRITREDYNAQFDALTRELNHIKAQLAMPTEVGGALNMLAELSAMLGLMKRQSQKTNILRVVESVHLDTSGDVERIELRPWARAAFLEVAHAYDRTYSAEAGSQGRKLSTPSEGLWWLLTMAGLMQREGQVEKLPLQPQLQLGDSP